MTTETKKPHLPFTKEYFQEKYSESEIQKSNLAKEVIELDMQICANCGKDITLAKEECRGWGGTGLYMKEEL